MSPHPSKNTPLPVQTTDTAVPHVRKRRRLHRRQESGSETIQDLPQVDAAKDQCEFGVGNQILSCFPTSDTVVPQHKFVSFVWNSNVPDFTQTNKVNIYLLSADSQQVVTQYLNHPNPRGRAGDVTVQVDDRFWPNNGTAWNGQNLSYPFYFVITRNDRRRDGTEPSQSIFNAVQTTFADNVVASMASASASASVASLSAALATTTGTPNITSPHAPADVQSGASSSGFPHWAIAVISILGFLAIASSCVLLFFICRCARRRSREDDYNKRSSMGSESPMMANVGHSAGSPLLAGGAAAAAHPTQDRHSLQSHGHPTSSVVSPERASTVSRSGSITDPGPFSGADAAIMADAFRKALRKPDFAGRPEEEGESPDNPEAHAPPDAKEGDELLSKELADEGRDIRSVSSSRGVKVETATLSDSGSTVQDHH